MQITIATVTGIVKKIISNEHTSGKLLLMTYYFVTNNSANSFGILIFQYINTFVNTK